MPNIFFTADLHFGHTNIIKMCNRPFNSIEEMDETLIANWNQTVRRNDEIYILGDLMLKGSADVAHSYLSRLNGKKYFICGNHDRFLQNMERYPDDLVWIKDYHMLKQNGRQ